MAIFLEYVIMVFSEDLEYHVESTTYDEIVIRSGKLLWTSGMFITNNILG